MKKIITIILILMISMVFITGCSTEEPPTVGGEPNVGAPSEPPIADSEPTNMDSDELVPPPLPEWGE